MLSYLHALVDASRTAGSPVAGIPAGTVVVRAADLLVRGDWSRREVRRRRGRAAVFCRPVVAAPVVIGRGGSVLADGWLPDFVRLGELERHLGDGVIEAIAGAALAKGG